jgi:hypothetical protein
MTAAVKGLLDSFDALPEPEKHQASVELLRRINTPEQGPLPEAALVEAADELFRALDAEEEGNAQR